MHRAGPIVDRRAGEVSNRTAAALHQHARMHICTCMCDVHACVRALKARYQIARTWPSLFPRMSLINEEPLTATV